MPGRVGRDDEKSRVRGGEQEPQIRLLERFRAVVEDERALRGILSDDDRRDAADRDVLDLEGIFLRTQDDWPRTRSFSRSRFSSSSFFSRANISCRRSSSSCSKL